jgi:hopanoid biosynthesis associated radical SAM protein HpnH
VSVPLIQQFRVGSFILKQRLKGNSKYPLVLMLEPLFRCNLACVGCGKIDYPDHILDKRLSVEECLGAADECGAPVVSIAGGEPLLHKEIGAIVDGLIERRKFVYLCTNALILEKKLDRFKPTPYLTFSVHLDGKREHHDHFVAREGTFDRAVAAIRAARARGFRVTVNCTVFNDADPKEMAEFFTFACEDLGVEGITIAPGYAYERAAVQEHFLSRTKTKQLFRDMLKLDPKRKWRFSQSTLYMDFLAGNQQYHCTPWGNPTRTVFGWQRPCYLIGEGYTSTFKELMEETEWERYGTGNYEKCANCMVHCGYEATAVADTTAHPLKAWKVFRGGIDTDKPMAPDVPLENQRPAEFVFEDLTRRLSEESEPGTGDKSDAA